MIDSNTARARLHAMIDAMPDEQVALVWMTFQSMLEGDGDDEELEGDESADDE